MWNKSFSILDNKVNLNMYKATLHYLFENSVLFMITLVRMLFHIADPKLVLMEKYTKKKLR